MNEYVVFKLITGEQVIATLINESEVGLVVVDPIIVTMRYIVRDGQHIEQAITSKFCQFAENNTYTFSKRNLIFYKKLNDDMIMYYTRIVKALNDADLVNAVQDDTVEDIPIPTDSVIH